MYVCMYVCVWPRALRSAECYGMWRLFEAMVAIMDGPARAGGSRQVATTVGREGACHGWAHGTVVILTSALTTSSPNFPQKPFVMMVTGWQLTRNAGDSNTYKANNCVNNGSNYLSVNLNEVLGAARAACPTDLAMMLRSKWPTCED